MTSTTPERWLPVVGYEGLYEVSNHGRVRSLDRVAYNSIGRRRSYRGQILKPHINRDNGRRMVWLRVDGIGHRFTVYTLVLTAFVGPRQTGLVACHSDGDCLNDGLDNLRWGTYQDNNYDAVLHGTHHQARKTHCPRGHVLAEPNLVRSMLIPKEPGKRTHRVCLACFNARSDRRRAFDRGLPFDFDSAAGTQYARIMKETTHVPLE